MATQLGVQGTYRSGLQWLSPLAIAIAIFLVAQQWSGLDTPDSEFYASLAIFTDQVTDRAPIDSYFWTRLGLIAPLHFLIQLFGIWEGFALYKALLILIITTSFFATTRKFTGFWRSTWLTAATASSSVIVAYLGNPYITGSIMAGTAALIALGIRLGSRAAATSGIVLGWMAMTYPGGALLGGTIWLALVIYGWRTHQHSATHIIRLLAYATGTTVLTLLAFVGVGRTLFPGLDWLQTNVDASGFDYSVYSSGEWVWLTDISLLVPAAVLVLAAINVRRATRRTPADLAVVVSASSIGFIVTYAPFFGAHFLEAPPSQAMLWPPAMVALALIATSRMPDAPAISAPHVVGALVGVTLIVAAGFFDPGIPFVLGLVVAALLVALVILSPQRSLTTMLAVTVFLAGSQLLQNSREARGQFLLDPYRWAYQANPNEAKIRTSVNAQQWLIDNTQDNDQVALWVDGPWVRGDRELYSVAAMQLWGDNRVTLEPTFGDAFSVNQIEQLQPTVIAMYGKSMDAVEVFWESLPAELTPTPPICYDFTWPIDPVSDFPSTTGHLCLTRLSS
jgi:hypothetical protein